MQEYCYNIIVSNNKGEKMNYSIKLSNGTVEEVLEVITEGMKTYQVPTGDVPSHVTAYHPDGVFVLAKTYGNTVVVEGWHI